MYRSNPADEREEKEHVQNHTFACLLFLSSSQGTVALHFIERQAVNFLLDRLQCLENAGFGVREDAIEDRGFTLLRSGKAGEFFLSWRLVNGKE